MRVKVKLPPGAKIDRNYLENAIRASLGPHGDPDKIWHLNDVPAIAQLEESLYAEGTADIRQAWEDTAHLLGIPVEPGLTKSTARLNLSGADTLKSRVKAAFFGTE